MNTLLFFISTGLVTFLTFVFFRLFGVKSNNIFISSTEKKIWDSRISGLLKRLLTLTNIFGTITSLATLLFLAGSAKLFGVFAFATGITIALSAIITNPITNKILSDNHVKKRYSDDEQVGGVIASLFWDGTKSGVVLSTMVKIISIIGIFSIIWLEISLFTNFASSYLGIENAFNKTVIAFITFFTIFYFVVQYGLRGFVFADLFHSPLIVLMGIILIAILFIMLLKGDFSFTAETIFIPKLSWSMAIVFGLHVLVLNLFQIICTEPHWFRLWLFKNVEITSQRASVMTTGIVWILLLFIGFSTYAITNQVGEDAIGMLLNKLSMSNPYFLFFFWIAATGALFSTVDVQLYSAFLVSSFKTKDGTLPVASKRFESPFLFSIFSSFLFAAIYFLVRYYNIGFEKILLVVVPFSLVVLPLFVAKLFDRKPSIYSLIISVSGYILVAGIGFILSEINFFATLSAIFVPVIVSIGTLAFQKKHSPTN